MRTYTVPGTTQADRPAAPAPAAPQAAGEYRILGAVFPADDPQWFFKLAGPADAVGKAEGAFDEALASVKFPQGVGGPPTVDAPAGWQKRGPTGMRAETLFKVVDGNRLEVSVIGSKGSLKQNLDRWAGQVGMPVPGDWGTLTRAVTAGPVKGVRVDVRGPKDPNAGGMGGPMMPPR